jgi:hypothetical protein
MGFDPTDGVEAGVDRWWLDLLDERCYIECINAESVHPFNLETALCLSKNWEKYLPPHEPGFPDASKA